MTNYLDLLRDAAEPLTPVEQKKRDLDAISSQKRSALSGLDFYSMAAGNARGTGLESASPDELAIRTLNPAELRFRYGDDVAPQLSDQAATAASTYGLDRFSVRSQSQRTDDTLRAVGSGFANSLAGIGVMAAGLANENWGATAAGWVDQGNQWVDSFNSEALRRRQIANQAGTELAYRDNLSKYHEEGADLSASLRRIGRDAIDAVAGATNDTTISGHGTAQGIGSLLAFRPITSALRAAGSAALTAAGRTNVLNVAGAQAIARAGATNAETMALGRSIADAARPSLIGSRGTSNLMRAGEALRGPAAIAAMESGGTYVDTANEIMGMTHDELLDGSPEYRELIKTMSPEDAQMSLASQAGFRAARNVAPVAAATGALVSRFEGAPFRAGSLRNVARNIGSEALEEGTQSLTGALASGEAIRTFADSNRDILAGAGEDLGVGALYGMTAAGTVQSPGAVYHGMRGAARLTAKGVRNFVVGRYKDTEAQIDRESPISSENVVTAANIINGSIDEVSDSLNQTINSAEGTEEQKTSEREFVNRLRSVLGITPKEASTLPESTRRITSTGNRLEAVRELSAQIPNLELGSLEHMEAIVAMQQLLEPIRAMQMADIRLLQEAPEGSEGRRALNAITWMLAQADKTPEVRKAEEHISNILSPEQIQRTIDLFGSDQAIRTPEGQAAAKATASAMALNPGMGNRQAAELILKHANRGVLQLTPNQRSAVQITLDLTTQHENMLAEKERLGIKDVIDLVSGEIISNSDPTAARNKDGSEKRSLRWYANRIQKAMHSANPEEAAGWMEELGLFAQHMQNKINALNQNYGEGDAVGIPNAPKVAYEALNPDHTSERVWYKSPEGLHVSATNATSVRLAQQMHLEGRMLVSAFNSLAAAFPSLGVEQIEFQGLDPALLEPVSEVVQRHKDSYAAQRKPQRAQSAQKPAKKAQAKTPAQEPQEAQAAQERVQEEPRPTLEERRERNRKANEEHKKKKEVAERKKREIKEKERIAESKPEEPKAEPEKSQELDLDSLIPEDDNTAARRGMVARFHGLWKPLTNRFLSSLRLRGDYSDGQPYSRIAGHESPLSWVREVLSDGDKFEELLGKTSNTYLDEDIADAYGSLLSGNENSKGLTAGHIKAIMKKNLKSFLSQKNISEALESGNVLRWNRGKALNIVQPVYNSNGKEIGLEYNEELLDAAVLAGIQWALNGDQITRSSDDLDFVELTGVEAYRISSAKRERIASGIPVPMVKIPIARLITQFWGVQPRNDVDRAYSDGIPESVAAEVMRAMVEADFLNSWKTELGAEEGVEPKTLWSFEVNKDKLSTELAQLPDAIQMAVLPDAEPSQFIGEDSIPPVADRQMNNPSVRNTPSQKRAIKTANNIKHRVNLPMMHFLGSFGPQDMAVLTGDTDPTWTIKNSNHNESVEGRISNYSRSYLESFNTIARMRNVGTKSDIPLKDMVIRFAHNMTRTGRLQMLGRYNSQASKLTRELILPTWSTLDLTNNEEHLRAFHLALAQHLGVNVHRQSYESSRDQVLAKLKSKEARPLMRAVREWLQKTDINSEEISKQKLDAREWNQLMVNAGFPATFGAFHAVIDYSRFMRARGRGRTQFETSLYLEADGITNGPIMAMLMMTIGGFTGGSSTQNFNWIEALKKGGISFGSRRDASTLIPLETPGASRVLDLYETAAVNSKAPINARRQTLRKDNERAGEIADALIKVMGTLFPGEVVLREGEIDLHRNITKNPLTITIYGSTPWGIAGSFTTRVMDSMYELQTRMASNVDQGFDPWTGVFESREEMEEFQKAMKLVTSSGIKKSKNGYFTTPESNYKHSSRKDFTFYTEELENLQSNFLASFVEPMVEGITETVGPGVMKAAETIRKATQVQSILLEDAFRRAVHAKLDDKRKNDPDYRNGDFLSRDEINEIESDMEKLFPNIKTKTQVFRVAKKASVLSEGKGLYSRALNDQYETEPDVVAPGNAGVSGIAFLNIGFGDGNMIQVVMQDTAMESILAVFDGINMPLDKIDQVSLAANKAVFTAGMGNPLQAVKDSFDTVMENSPEEFSLTEQGWEDLARAFYGSTNKTFVKKIKSDLKQEMDSLKKQIDFSARSIDARHRAIQKVGGMSIDHMASAGNPFFYGKETDLTEQQYLELLQAEYEKAMAESSQSKAAQETTLKDKGEPDEVSGTGVRLFRWENFKHLSKELGLSPDQTTILNQILGSNGIKDYKIVAGTRDQILSYRVSKGQDIDVFDENTNGLISLGDQTIYLVNPNSESFTHELLHAATMSTLLAYYGEQDLGPNKKIISEAIERLQEMAIEFLTGDMEYQLPVEAREAYLDAKAAMEGFASTSHMDPVAANAGMVGEFIAWTLSNNKLTEELKKKKLPKALQWLKDVLKAVRDMIWGKQKMTAPQEDWFSNIQFNASILIRTQSDVSKIFSENTLKHSSGSPRLQNIRDSFQRLILDQITKHQKIDQEKASKNQAQAITATQEVARKAAHAFGLTHLEESTLVAVSSALTTATGLDSQLMMGFQDMYRQVQDQLKIEHFFKEEVEDPWANEKYNIIMGRRDRFYSQDNISNLLPVFVGLGLVSEDFRRVLADLPLPKGKTDTSSFDALVGSSANQGMEALNRFLTKQGNKPTVKAALDAMADSLMKNIHDEKTMLDSLEEMTDRGLGLNSYVRDALQHASRKAWDFGEHIENTSDNRLVKGVGRAISIISSVANEEKADIVADGVLATSTRLNLPNTLMHLVKDFMGRTEAVGKVYDLIKPIRAMVQQVRQQFRDEVPGAILKKFSERPSDESLSAMFRGMGKTDIAALLDLGVDRKEVMDLMVDPRKRSALISKLENQLKQMDKKHYNILEKKMKQLADFMNSKGVGRNLLRNATAVANLWMEPGTVNRKAPSAEMIEAVDQLVSLYAFEGLSKNDKDAIKLLVENEPTGVDFVLAYLEGQRKTEMARAKLGRAKYNYYKGHIPSLPENQGHLIVAEDTEFTNLKLSGYTRIANYGGMSLGANRVSMGYYYSSAPSQAAFSQGMMQNITQSGYGVERSTGFTLGHTAGRITNRHMVRKLIQRMQSDTGKFENLMPIYDQGRIVAFERSIDPKYLQQLQPSTMIHSMLGVWRGRQIEEMLSTKVNEQLLDTLHENWEENRNGPSSDLYVNLLDPKVLDRVQQDAVRLFSEDTIKYAESLFGRGTLMVRADMLDDVTGYRNPSVGDLWTNNNRLKKETNETIRRILIGFFGADAYKNLVKAEQLVQGVVSDLRTLIVVKSGLVPAINIISNVYQLISRGLSPIRMAREFPKKLNEINTYVRTKLEQVELEAQIRAAGNDTRLKTKLHARIRSITDSHKRLTIWPLIEAGEFSTIADVGMSREDLKLSDGRIGDYLGQQVDKLPEGLKTAAKYGLITKDTSLFQGLQKSVQYGDFLAKALLYDHLLKKENKSREQALAQITEEFVNYDRLPGRSRAYLENMGMLWFYNFKLRSVKIGLSILRNNPLHALLTMGLPMPYGIGTPVNENVIYKAMEGTLGYSIGPGMGLRAPSLNPWINMVN